MGVRHLEKSNVEKDLGVLKQIRCELVMQQGNKKGGNKEVIVLLLITLLRLDVK